MTIVVAIKCTDGAVIACDSMLTVGGFAQHSGQKVHILAGPPQQIYAFAGDLALAERFRTEAGLKANLIGQHHKMAYAIAVGNALVQNLAATGLDPLKADLATVLAFVKDGVPEVCGFICGSQPRFLDTHHFDWAVGSGAAASTPFLKFLTDVWLQGRQPTVAEGKLLAVWAVKYAIETMAGGVGEPVDLATIEKTGETTWEVRELTPEQIAETLEAISSAKDALREWKDGAHSEEPTDEIPAPPQENQTTNGAGGGT